MTEGSRSGAPRLASATLRDFSAYVWQATGLVGAALALGLATSIDAYAVAGLFGSAAAALVVGVLFTYRRFGTLIAIWLFLLLQPLLSAVMGGESAVGNLVNIADIPILLVIGSLGFLFAARAHATVVHWLLIAAGVVLVCGFASDLAAGAPLTPSIVGAMLRMKLFLVLGAVLSVQWTPALAIRTREVIILSATVAAFVGIFDFASGGVLRGIFADPTTHTVRLGYVSAGGLFQNIAVMSTFMAIAFTVLLGMTWQGKASRRVPQILFLGLAALSTLRLKAMMSILAGAAALAITSRRVRSRLVLVPTLAVLAMSVSITLTQRDVVTEVITEQASKYTTGNPQPRQRLQAVSIEIARDNFPLGAGFGRFGSAPSIQRGSYSPIYPQYGLSKYYGFGPNEAVSFALDTSWPGLLGEVGALGFLAFVSTILVLTVSLFRRAQQDDVRSNFASIGFGVMVVIIIDSLARPTVFDSFSLLTAVLIMAPGLWLVSGRVRSAEEEPT